MSESIEEGKQELVCGVCGFKTESRKGLAGHMRLSHQKPTSLEGYKQYVDDLLAKLEEAWEARVKAHFEADHKRIDALEEQINDKENVQPSDCIDDFNKLIEVNSQILHSLEQLKNDAGKKFAVTAKLIESLQDVIIKIEPRVKKCADDINGVAFLKGQKIENEITET